jgi:phosphatidate cytidylyltransferase
MHFKRIATALVALPFFYFYIMKPPPVFFLALLVLATGIAQTEFHLMYKTDRSLAVPAVICGSLLLFSAFLTDRYHFFGFSPTSSVIMFSIMLMLVIRLFTKKDPSSSLRDLAPALTGFLYIPVLMLSQWHLRLRGPEWIIFLYGCVWASDSLALYIGTGIGKRKLYPEMSPKKTVEGAIASVVGGMLSTLLLSYLFPSGLMSMTQWIVMGAVIGATTVVSDLAESMFKRDAGVKDSGGFIPGHGGILDKLDGSLFAGPVLYWMLFLML